MKPTQQTPSTRSALTIIGPQIRMKTQLAAIVCLLAPTSAFAGLIDYTEIMASTELTAHSSFPVEEISDGITSDAFPFNGFVSRGVQTGTVHLDFSTSYDLTSFTIFNDVNVRAEGVRSFRLDFFDESMASLGSSMNYIAPFNQVEGQEYEFGVVRNVSRVDLVVLSTYSTGFGIEIREVQFTAVPTPGSASLLAIGGLLAARRRR